MSHSRSVIVIGSGIIGLSTAYFAAKRGLEVTVIDRNPADAESCSTGNAGMVVPSHFVPLAAPGMVRLGLRWMLNPESPFYVKPRFDLDLFRWGWFFNQAATATHVERAAPLLRDLNLASRAAYEALAAEPGFDFGLVQKGLLMLCATRETLKEESAMAHRSRALRVPAVILSPHETASLDPSIAMSVAGSVYFPKDCHLDPARLLTSLRTAAAALGVQFVHGAEVDGWRHRQGKIAAVLTGKGEFSADEYVLAGGSWSGTLARDLGIGLPLQAGKGYSLTMTQPKERPEICAILTEARVAVTPLPGGRLRFGGTMEIAGLNESITQRRVRGIVKSVSRYYPAFSERDFDGIPPWRGLRPCSPDGMPYIGRFGAWKNLTAATGHAMMGLSLAPITGQIVSQVLVGEAPPFDLRQLSPDRYA